MPAINMQSETVDLTIWEAKERAGLLALETVEWREKRLIAQDPNTTADVLKSFTDFLLDELEQWYPGQPMNRAPDVQANMLLLGEAIFAHPNTPPQDWGWLLSKMLARELGEQALITKAICRNPILSFVYLEMPDFWLSFCDDGCKALLREETLPTLAVRSMIRQEDLSVAEAVRLHISQSSLPRTPQEGCKALTAFWKGYCIRQRKDPDHRFHWGYGEDWHAEMVEVGLAPAWMTPFYDNVPPKASEASELGRRSAEHIRQRLASYSDYAPLLRPDTSPDELMQIARTQIVRDYDDVPLTLLQHPRITVDILRYMAGLPLLKDVRMQLAVHPLTPADVLKRLVDAPLRDDWTAKDARNEALRNENTTIRRLACRHPNAPSDLTLDACRAFIKATSPPHPFMELPLVDFVTALRGIPPDEIRVDTIEATDWAFPLISALHLPLTDTPFDEWGRSPLDRMRYLSHHGNYFVRWTAQTRLAEPDFVFRWADEE